MRLGFSRFEFSVSGQQGRALVFLPNSNTMRSTSSTENESAGFEINRRREMFKQQENGLIQNRICVKLCPRKSACFLEFGSA
jgi:hypothetical protein